MSLNGRIGNVVVSELPDIENPLFTLLLANYGMHTYKMARPERNSSLPFSQAVSPLSLSLSTYI